MAEYLTDYGPLIGDRQTAVTFGAVVQGIIGAGSVVCERIAAQSAVLAAAQDGASGSAAWRAGRAPSGPSWTRNI